MKQYLDLMRHILETGRRTVLMWTNSPRRHEEPEDSTEKSY